jgi:hypothetical protein
LLAETLSKVSRSINAVFIMPPLYIKPYHRPHGV